MKAHKSQLRIGVLSLLSDRRYADLWDFATRSKAEYCREHGYKFYLGNGNEIDRGRHPSWSKISFILKHLSNFDYVLWLDGDACIANSKLKIESLFAKEIEKGVDITVKSDWNHINLGVFLLKNSKWSHQFLRQIYQTKKEELTQPLQCKFDEWWEQAVVIDAYNGDPAVRSHFEVVRDNRISMNQYPAADGFTYVDTGQFKGFFEKGDWIVHFCSSAAYPPYSWAQFMLNQLRTKGHGYLKAPRLLWFKDFFLEIVSQRFLRVLYGIRSTLSTGVLSNRSR